MITSQQIKNIIKEKVTGQVKPAHDAFGHHYQDVKSGNIYDSVTTQTGILESPHLKKWAAKMAVDFIEENQHKITEQNKEDIYKAAILAHQDIFEDAGNIGTQIHDIVDKYIVDWMNNNKQPDDIRNYIVGEDVRLWAGTRSAEMFFNDFRPIPIASELKVASGKHKFGGTLDALMMLPKVVKNREGDKNCEHQWMGSPNNNNIQKCFKCDRKEIYQLNLVDWKTSNSINKDTYAIQTSAYLYALKEMTGLKCKRIIIVRLDKKKANYEILEVNDIAGAFKAFKSITKTYQWLNNKKAKLVSRVAKARISIDDL